MTDRYPSRACQVGVACQVGGACQVGSTGGMYIRWHVGGGGGVVLAMYGVACHCVVVYRSCSG